MEAEGGFETLLKLVDWQEAGIKPASLKMWWAKHKEADEKRRQRELSAAKRKEAEAQRKKDRDVALAKLTNRERKLLGIK